MIGLLRQSGQNGGRSGIQYSGLGIAMNYVNTWVPIVCERWDVSDIHDVDSLRYPALSLIHISEPTRPY